CTDGDGDGVCDTIDPAFDFDQDGVPNHFDLDADNDGVYDVVETGGVDANNDGRADDTDGNPANNDGVPSTAGTGNAPIDSGTDPTTPDFLDLDSDEDGCSDANEAYNDPNADAGDGGQYGAGDPLTLGAGVDPDGTVTAAPYTAPADNDTNGIADYTEMGPDADADGIPDGCDDTFNDADMDGIPDGIDVDDDNDGIDDITESGGNEPNGDADGDGVPNYLDTTDDAGTGDGSVTDYTDSNGDGIPDVYDFDNDGIPNHLDLDGDNDGILDIVESGNGALDTDGDGDVDDGDAVFSDANMDGQDDNAALNTPTDSDGGNGNPDFLDIDADDDGIPDNVEAQPTDAYVSLTPIFVDSNMNGVNDSYEGGLMVEDTDGDMIPDYQDPDSDNDGVSDLLEAGQGTFTGADTDGDGLDDGFDDDNSAPGVPFDVNDNLDTGADGTDNDDDPSTAEVDFRETTDNDGDGVPDSLDLDDDNDGIADVDENPNGQDPTGDDNGDGIPNFMDPVTGGGDANGDGIADDFDFDGDGVPNHFDLDADNDGIYDVTETGGTDDNNDGLADDTDGDPTNNNGIPNTAGTGNTPINSGTDPATPDFLDLDSDEDGCSDANEYFNGANADGGDGGQYGVGDPLTLAGGGVDTNGAVITAPYNNTGGEDTDGNGVSDYTEIGPEADADGIANACDLDDDGDGNPDDNEIANGNDPLSPNTMDDFGMTNVGTPITVDILANDDYLPQNDPNVLGTTTITDTGLGTAMGTVVFDPATGEVTYTPDAAENGDVTIVYEVCSDDGTNAPVCMTAVITITITGTDNDGDGVFDFADLDDDNDGILDTDETPAGFPNPSDDDDSDGIPNYADTDIGVDANGDGIVDAYDNDGDGVPNHFDLDADNDGIYDVIESGGIDTDNDGRADDTDGDPSNNNGIPNSAGTGNTPINSGTDPATPDFLDIDSDEDGCSDANEYFNNPNADGGDGGQYGVGDPLTLAGGDVDANGAVITAPYNNSGGEDTDGNSISDYTEVGPEFDTDGIANACDPDDDGDGNPDDMDPNPTAATAVDDSAMTDVGVAVTTSVLDNDDYLDNNDPNNLGTTTVTDTATGTATGVVTIDPITGEVTYVPSANEAGQTVTIVYEVCNDESGVPVCTQATIFIDVDGPDNDGDGVLDIVDLDDDNDGILDTDETPAGFPAPSGDDDNDGIPNYMDTDLGPDANGDGIVDAYDNDGDGVPNHFDLDADNDGIYDVTETGGTDDNNDGLADDTDGDPTNNNGIPSTAGTGNTPINSGTDPATPDFLDLDSDEDGCSDANEAYNDPNADAADGGQYGAGDPLTLGAGVEPDGTVTAAPYTNPNVPANNFPADTDANGIPDYQEVGPEADADGIANACDLDDDGDGNPDDNEIANGNDPLSPNTMDDFGMTNVGTPVTIDILSNDDYLPNNDPNVLGTTTITDTGLGTAMGTVVFDPATGEVTYTPDAAEFGDVTIVYEVCSDDGVNAPVCMQATVTITIMGTDNDGDGVPDAVDLDDDNDGILDSDEAMGLLDPSDDDDNDGIPNYMDTDLGVDANGDGIVDAYDFDGDGVPNHFDLDADNDGIYDVDETEGIDTNNDGLADDNDGDPTNNNGVPNTANGGAGNPPINSGTDPATPDFLDLDSDEDGCSDANEAYNDPNADAGDGGQFGLGDPLTLGEGEVAPNGTVIAAGYDTGVVSDVTTPGPDIDNDGLAAVCDPDDDGDGNPDDTDPNPLTPVAVDDNAATDIGVPVTVSVLDNDDYLDNNDPTNLGITTVTDTGTGTAIGAVTIDPVTGEITYTPAATEAGQTVTIVYEVCNDESGAPICTQATVFIEVDGPDNDGDGVPDAVDLDDDNDGVLDTDEAAGLLDPSGDDDLDGIPNFMDTDLGPDANGDGIVDDYDFDGDGVPNHFDLDADNDGIYDVDETGGTDDNNDGLADDNDGDPTNNNGVPNTANGGTGNPPIDSGPTAGTPDFLDLDSDEDGCSDANEAYNDPNADAGDGGQFGLGDPLTLGEGEVAPNGTVIAAGYDTGVVSDVTTPGPDIDNDGIAAVCDPDDDGDGNPDETDPNPLTPVAVDDNGETQAGVPVTVGVLDNDDYLDNNDPNNLGTTTVTDTGLGTAQGIVVIDPITGEITYTPTAEENGSTVTIVYEVCNDESGTPICTQATVFIVVTGPDTDGDGVPDSIDLDDDNDGILDTDEAMGLPIPSNDDDMDGIPNFADPDNGPDANGDGIVDAYDQDGDGVPNHLDLDADNDGIYDVDEVGGIDANNDGFADDTDGDPTNNNGVPNSANSGLGTIPFDTDGDGDLDFLDLDSDDDGCSDANEAYNDPNADGGDGGMYGVGDPLTLAEGEVDDFGSVETAPYDTGQVIAVVEAGPDPDQDGLANSCDLDDDGDGVSDEQEIIDGTDPLDPCDYVEENQDPNNTAASYDALDCDGDGVTNGDELNDGTSPLDPCDFVIASITLPPSGDFLVADCDGDGVINGDELSDGTDPLDLCDFVTSSITVQPSQEWLDFDCDGDGVSNGQELMDETEPLDPCDYDFNSQTIDYENQIVEGVSDDWLELDCDDDGLINGIEIADNNDNGIPDYDEVNNGDPNSDDNLDVFDILTPNGDGLNDVFVIRGIEQYPNNTLEIYNRWGVKVYVAEGYGQGDKFFRGFSDGRATVDRGERLPVGTYYYILNYVNDNGENKRLAGPLYINRR
ncbi:gliding motility-associated C-terminal domain-containing protein, partial [Marinirhabdus gelatinilytica]